MSGIHTSVVTNAHEYTRNDSPWIIGEHQSIYGKLIHYLSGGGMTTFGRTVEQEKVRRNHRRFVLWASGAGILWIFFYFA